MVLLSNSSGLRQKGESQDGCFKKAQHAKISEKNIFLPPDTDTACAFQGVRNVCFSEIWCALLS